MDRKQLLTIIRAALLDHPHVISADVIDDGEIGVETTDGRHFVTAQSHD
ncbi:hypothetical protein SAZ11_08390 [Streptomyces sp. FXJ1.4098]|nr:hypothetical protein [Streptomyces sp. FXJ1.4098]